MILRIWHGYTTPENAAAYEQLLEGEIFETIAGKSNDGYKGIQLLKRTLPNEIEFITIMSFTGYDAVKAFAGEDYEVSFVIPAAHKLLSRYDERAQHYEVIHALAYP